MNNNGQELIISGNNLSLTEALKHTVEEKMTKLFEHEGHIIRIRIELGFTPNVSKEKEHWARGRIEIRGKSLFSRVESDDLYKSIDQLTDKLDRMLRRRSRLRVLKRKETHDVDIPANLPKVHTA